MYVCILRTDSSIQIQKRKFPASHLLISQIVGRHVNSSLSDPYICGGGAGGRVFQAWNREPWKDVSKYCWWKKSCTTCCIWNPMKNEYSRWQLVQDCIRQQYHDRTRIRNPRYLHPDHPDHPTQAMPRKLFDLSIWDHLKTICLPSPSFL